MTNIFPICGSTEKCICVDEPKNVCKDLHGQFVVLDLYNGLLKRAILLQEDRPEIYLEMSKLAAEKAVQFAKFLPHSFIEEQKQKAKEEQAVKIQKLADMGFVAGPLGDDGVLFDVDQLEDEDTMKKVKAIISGQ